MSKVNQPVGVIGHIDHGKMSLAAAITKVLARQEAQERSMKDAQALINQIKRGENHGE